MLEEVVISVSLVVAVGMIIVIARACKKLVDHCCRKNTGVVDQRSEPTEAVVNTEVLVHNMDQFLNDIEKEKPMKFTSDQLMHATYNYAHKLGSGGFGAVYRGTLVDGTIVAVKVLHESSDYERRKEQFMAEVGTIGRAHHMNLLRLFGYCFERNLTALVYEFMSSGSLDKYLFRENNILTFGKLHEIAVGTAKGIAYLHEECQQRIIHHDIKPENILLDDKFCPKVADFGLAKLCNREKSHITMTRPRGTPGYAAPELWFPFPVTHKCDVYGFGMLLFEIIGGKRNHDMNLSESQVQEWFPKQVWIKFNKGELGELLIDCGIAEKDEVIAERMARIALWCVQYKSDLRPEMSVVVKMLEGLVNIPNPSNPFQHLMDEDLYHRNHQVNAARINASISTDSG